MKKKFIILVLLFTSCTLIFAETTDGPVEIQYEILNLFFPGTVQIAQGKPEGYAYLWGTAASIGGSFMLGPITPDGEWYNALGGCMNSWGTAITAYSHYAYRWDTGDLGRTGPRPSFVELLSSPFNGEFLSSEYVFPLIGVTALNFLGSFLVQDEDTMANIGSWFGAETVDFWGTEMNPWLGASLYLTTSAVQMMGVAVAEEVLCRGLMLPELGITSTSLLFGAFHLGNLIQKDLSEEHLTESLIEVGTQTAAAACIGFILADQVEQNDGDLGQAIAFHFWWNLISYGLSLINYAAENPVAAPAQASEAPVQLGYTATPSLQGGFSLGVQLRF